MDLTSRTKLNGLAKYAWAVLAYNVGVILWGAYVRATGSGAGCGGHWPLCNGQVVPLSSQAATLIEFSHRVSSGLTLLAVLGLAIWAFRAYPKGHPVRLGAGLALFFTLTEALVGAGLVLFQLVAQNASALRAASVAVHLANTFLLLASLTLTALWASGGVPLRLRGQGWAAWGLGLGLVGVLLLGISGAITALGDTLFPASSLAEGLQQDFSPAAQFMIRLRVFHPLIAVSVGILVIFVAYSLGFSNPDEGTARSIAKALVGLVALQWLAGIANVALLAPIWMQLLHLLLADLVWIMLVLLAATVLAQTTPRLQPAIAGRREQPRPIKE
jgi:protoheme IX farnesyltransferase